MPGRPLGLRPGVDLTKALRLAAADPPLMSAGHGPGSDGRVRWTQMTTATSNAFTLEDLEALPDDGNRYELMGGAIVMTPAPEPVHQRVAGRLFRMLEDACPRGHEVFIAPIDYDLPGDQRLEPDLIVVPDASVGPKRLAGPALLVAEIVSPGSRLNDTITKPGRSRRSAAWLIMPAAKACSAPSLAAIGRRRDCPSRGSAAHRRPRNR